MSTSKKQLNKMRRAMQILSVAVVLAVTACGSKVTAPMVDKTDPYLQTF